MKRKLFVFVAAVALASALAPGQSGRRERQRKPRTPEPGKMPPAGARMPRRWLPVDANGWTILNPAPDSRILYVSSSVGDDATGRAYGASDAAVGGDPTAPAGAVRPFQTIPAAMAKARPGAPDWVLLKRGDSWRDVSIRALPGRSKAAPSVVAAYGPADAARPRIVGQTAAVALGSGPAGISHAVVVGVELYCSFDDPAAPDYRRPAAPGADARRGGRSRLSLSVGPRGGMSNVLVEDCLLRFVALHVGGPTGVMTDVVLRRNAVLDVYPTRGHNQGLWGSHGSILLEECLFDHDGWLHRNVPANRGKPGLANMFSHNTYTTQMYCTVFRGNTFLRGASINNKFTANYGPGSVRDVVLEDNLYVDGEIGVSMSGNNPAPLRWVNCRIVRNVLLDIGRCRPTGRTLGWGVEATDWDGGEISGNLFLRQKSDEVRNVWGLNVGAGRDDARDGEVWARNLTIRGNVFHGLKNARQAMNVKGAGHMRNVTVAGNLFQFVGVPGTLVRTDGLGAGLVFRDNVYDSAAEPDQWFAVGPKRLTFAQWVRESGERGARKERVNFPDPGRGIEAYMKSLGKKPTFDAFVAEVRKQSRGHWRKELTAPVINAWIREGFTAPSPKER